MSRLWERAQAGETVEGPRRTVNESLLTLLVSLGGYIHPLFTDADHAARSGFPATPLPGPGLLHLLGGLAEQSGVFDESVISLLGFDEIRFVRPVVAGTTVGLRAEFLAAEPSSRAGRGVVTVRWVAVDGAGGTLASAVARFLVHTTPPGVDDGAAASTTKAAPAG